MKTKLTALALAATLAAAAPARAELVVPSLSYRTGPYGANGTQYADGFADYFTLLNERDGGIGGERIQVPECETAYNTEKGVECYEATKDTGALVYNPLSTGITYQLIPKVSVDKKVLYTPGYGRTSAKNGKVFEWVFNAPANYWDGASVAIKYLLDENGGDLSGKKIALVYHNSAYGKEPIRTLQKLSEKHGFELSEIPIDPPGQEQKSQWLQIRRERPDYVIMYGWGVMNQAAIQEAANIRFPMENFIGIWWAGSEVDVLPVGAGANGYKALTFNGVGMDYPVYDDMRKFVIEPGKASQGGQYVGSALYSRGMYAAVVIAEAIRKAQEIAGTAAIDAQQLRDGFEQLDITPERLTEIGLPDFGPEISLSCANHGGSGMARLQQWDAEAKQWNLISDFTEPDQEVLEPLIAEDSEAYAKEAGITPRDCN
ncbi:MAG: ABC transporter substrate-binding protein [Paracoccus sp. (in: a-proteobacteria)]|jgi:branched-chain amino acid transport system substrate-binding protein|uniref:ABC transporter substrate-binding protein n=2 Tax=Paracoccus TaxID=265 RepID=UPI000C3A8200|nr:MULTISPECIES: ABC transporter substrate-binding protein [unclassified Paracoccus (in: a-proteobacteria)]MAN55706.1 ABC transporter permease [Paracoccus sp. (in: a-proteobacteria)]MBA47806.1 ABC transporter permease [Paracoccus sp. (in: a-proteobacteria)]MCS5601490.1 ABC transporter substrate-binding protein [Paracoccus sp. (in: a-proteobacteria)]MDB2490145.1 ABC transporter substrate-binding protein [Paracoccus sp. (in: a-proteobacteria)]MDB2551733.1 ABC transporter substrate-binding protei|tara:strand:+ start:2373 stop:3662 length:1290 start_codon:yes stop_codon:yes gene_type:complete